jgi:purine-cytosine permease-like protein
MSSSPNPFEPPTEFPLEPNQPTAERILRIRFAVSTWVCGVMGIACMPYFSLAPDRKYIFYGSESERLALIMAWIAPFACGVASVVTAVCLFRLSRISDKIGALAAIILVGFLPVFSAVYAWSVILFPWSSNR